MAKELAVHYANAVDDVLRLGSVTSVLVNQNAQYEPIDAGSVKVYTNTYGALNNYDATATTTDAYGTRRHVGNATQIYTLAERKAINEVIDAVDASAMPPMISDPATYLASYMEQVIVPYVDTQRLAKLAAGTTPVVTAITSANAYETLVTQRTSLIDEEVSLSDVVIFASADFIGKLQLDPKFIQNDRLPVGMQDFKGIAGAVGETPVFAVPASRLPLNTNYIMTYKGSMITPNQLTSMKTITPDENQRAYAWELKGVMYFDNFVLNSKANTVIHSTSA